MRMLGNSCILEAVTVCFLGSEFNFWLIDPRKRGQRRRDQISQEAVKQNRIAGTVRRNPSQCDAEHCWKRM